MRRKKKNSCEFHSPRIAIDQTGKGLVEERKLARTPVEPKNKNWTTYYSLSASRMLKVVCPMDFPGHIGKKISNPIERIKIYTNPYLVNVSKSIKLAGKKKLNGSYG